jgi:hypothetical protein
LELGAGSPVIEGEDVLVAGASVLGAGDARDDGKRALAGMVGEEEVAGAGDPAPGATDGAAAEEGLWGEADEDLPEGDLLREAAAGRRRSCP